MCPLPNTVVSYIYLPLFTQSALQKGKVTWAPIAYPQTATPPAMNVEWKEWKENWPLIWCLSSLSILERTQWRSLGQALVIQSIHGILSNERLESSQEHQEGKVKINSRLEIVLRFMHYLLSSTSENVWNSLGFIVMEPKNDSSVKCTWTGY